MSAVNRNIFYSFLRLIPIFLLLFLAFSDFDFSFHSKKFVTFNLIHILIYFWVLKKPQFLGSGLIFFAGIINDIVTGLPIGISSIEFLILCGIASYFKNITLRPSLFYDWISFLPSVLIINSIHYFILNIFFEIELNYFYLLLSSIFTFILYPLAAFVFNLLVNLISVRDND